MSEQLKQLENLQTLLHEVNEEFSRAARPLENLSELDGEQREQIGAALKKIFARWEAVTKQISRALQIPVQDVK